MTTADEHAPTHVDLDVVGMTCASCAARIEKRLNKLEGVEATVNYATENAAVDFDPERVAPEDLIAAIEAAGYHASLSEPEPTEAEDDLAYLHVHPLEGSRPGTVTFEADLGEPGRYALFFQFKHGGTVHTVPFTLVAG